jgi:hypothetical protein
MPLKICDLRDIGLREFTAENWVLRAEKSPDQEKVRFSVLMSKKCGVGKIIACQIEDFPDRLYLRG